MKIAISLSGTIREPQKSLKSLELFSGHDVDAYIHTWRDIATTVEHSWSHRSSVEPEAELIAKYSPVGLRIESWSKKKEEYEAILKRWIGSGLKEYTNLGMLGMFWSIQNSWRMIPWPNDYDLIVRMRFDCLLIDSPIDKPRASGWMIPCDNDYGGVNDQLGWLWVENRDAEDARSVAEDYLGVFDRLDAMIKADVPYHPEHLIQASLSTSSSQTVRVPFNYTIH